MNDSVLTVLFPGALLHEVMCAIQVLSERFRVEVATPDGRAHADASGLIVQAQRSFAQARSRDYRCVLIPGGDLGSVVSDDDLAGLLRESYSGGAVLGAICAGPLALARAGLLKGRAYTQAGCYPASVEHLWSGAEFRRAPLVVSDRIITALPEAHIDFAIQISVALGMFRDEGERERRRRFYKGVFQRDWSATGAMAES